MYMCVLVYTFFEVGEPLMFLIVDGNPTHTCTCTYDTYMYIPVVHNTDYLSVTKVNCTLILRFPKEKI